jgi:hypothetical protein
MSNVSVQYLGDSVDDESLTQTEFGKYFKGSELVVAGKLTDSMSSTVNLQIVGNFQDGDLVLSGNFKGKVRFLFQCSFIGNN